MPFASQAQAAFLEHHPEKIGGESALKEWEDATRGKKLPKRKHPKKEKKAAVPASAPVRMRHTAKPR
jgi:hypothetical protein